jgi:hypothetical protein
LTAGNRRRHSTDYSAVQDSSRIDTLSTLAQTATAGGTQPVASTFSERIAHSFALLYEFVPALFAALVMLFVGYLVAKLVEKGVYKLLRSMRFNSLLERGGVMHAIDRSGSHLNPAKVIAKFLFWIVMFAVLLVAANSIGPEPCTADRRWRGWAAEA